MAAHRASNLAGQIEFIILDGSARWLGPKIGGHYWPALHRTADGRWFAARWTLDGYDGPPGRPLFVELTADDAASWFEAYRLEFPPQLVAALSGPPPAAGSGRTAEPTGDDRPVSVDARDTNARVKEVLERDRNATSVDIEKATGIPDQTVRRSKAWKERRKGQARQEPKITDAMEHARPLDAPMLAAIDSEAADPAEIVADRDDPTEARRHRFLEEATPGQKARLHRLPLAEQERELEAWDLTGEFQPDEPPLPAPLRRRMDGRSRDDR